MTASGSERLLVGGPWLVPWEEWLLLLALAEGLGGLNDDGEHAEHGDEDKGLLANDGGVDCRRKRRDAKEQ